MVRWALVGLVVWALPVAARANEADAAARGRKALLTRAFTPAVWTLDSYENTWKLWGAKEKPANYDQAFMHRYGLHPAPYENGGQPMGLRIGKGLFGKGLASDCLMCHGGSIAGKSYIGLGNASLDIQALWEDLSKAGGGSGKLPFTFTRVRGTSEAGMMAVFLLSHREPDLKLRPVAYELGLKDDLCEDPPAWWLLKKKQTMYHTGTTDARSVRSLMQFMLSPPNSLATFTQEEATFTDIQAFLRSLTPPKYPFAIEQDLAIKGEKLFNRTCSKCHGTYGEKWTYPNKVVPIDEIGTDRARFEGFTQKWADHYNKSWFGQEKRADGKGVYVLNKIVGYQAPPLDGIWATAPYFHNGSAPTVYHVLNSKARPKIFTRSYKTGAGEYDQAKLGWKVQVLERGPDMSLPDIERRKVYDTTQTGRGNGGHPFGDDFTDDERRAVIEYLKTL